MEDFYKTKLRPFLLDLVDEHMGTHGDDKYIDVRDLPEVTKNEFIALMAIDDKEPITHDLYMGDELFIFASTYDPDCDTDSQQELIKAIRKSMFDAYRRKMQSYVDEVYSEQYTESQDSMGMRAVKDEQTGETLWIRR